MSANNRVTLIGNLGQDPVLRQTDSGTAVCNISLAVDRSFVRVHPDGRRERVSKCDWVPVACWSTLAETCSQWLKKGSLVAVEGTVRQRQYTDAEDKVHNTLEIRADDVQFLANIRSAEEVAGRVAVATQASA